MQKHKPMRKDYAIRHYGGVRQVARILDITTQGVRKWGEFVPPKRADQLREHGGRK